MEHIKKSYGKMDQTKHSLIGGDTRRIEIIGECRYIQWNGR